MSSDCVVAREAGSEMPSGKTKKECAACHEWLTKRGFSKKQWTKQMRRCAVCVGGGIHIETDETEAEAEQTEETKEEMEAAEGSVNQDEAPNDYEANCTTSARNWTK